MTPQERQMIDDLFDRLSRLESAPRDPDAVASIVQGQRKAPNALYALVQTVLVQDEALRRANGRIQELEAASGPAQPQSTGFLDSMRETIFGSGPQRGSVPNVRPPEGAGRPVWNSGQATPQSPQPGSYNPGSYNPGSYNQSGYSQPYAAPQSPFGGGSSFLGTAAAAAAGMIGGSMLLGGIRSMMGGSHYGFGGDPSTVVVDNLAGPSSAQSSPWASSSDSELSRDAGIDDIGSSADRSDRSGLYDSASNDDDRDAMDLDSDNFGSNSDGDSDFA
jgi:hypothetical protein